MRRSRLTYFFLIITTILVGLLSRHIEGVPMFVGDILWGLMVYFIVRFLFIGKSIKWVTIVSLLFCYSIEFSQLYQAPWINSIRHTVVGGLILGETFFWGDMVFYTIGISAGILINVLLNKRPANRSGIS
ncbi:DUF2809 domain-containing protein [Mucilaginibacter sp.]|uniref:ribosomal maturation YjgA family protein n=1 Tax=Mucilaginibacter sp. TaxID=1882438 RepID=UPI00261FB017|nr:DUF2809 domain-containing protein [Mucilaginibacter sp.]